MQRYQAKIEAVAYGQKFVANLEFYLPQGSSGADIVHVAEKYALARGWQRVVVSTNESMPMFALSETSIVTQNPVDR